jgi:hypothetical protein
MVVAFQQSLPNSRLHRTVSAIEIARASPGKARTVSSFSAILAAADLDPNLSRYSVLI